LLPVERRRWDRRGDPLVIVATVPVQVQQLLDRVVEQMPVHERFISGAVEAATSEELTRLEVYLEFCATKSLTVEYLATSYLTIVEDTLEEQLYFNRHGHYRRSTFEAVADEVYFDREYMDRYMYGLAISTFLWPNHVAMARFFRASLPREGRARYLEVGPGHGFLLLTALELGSFADCLAVDLSAASIDQTRSVVTHFHPDARVRFEQRDFLDADDLQPGSFDAIVMGEVLEHVEHPDVFLRRIAELASNDAFIFVTTCINAPAIDHIYLWRTTVELESMIANAGLTVVEALRLPYEGKSLDESRELKLPINVAYVLTRR
jgi:2-polyprenyl-3-methyl-5-hydroxy-6-metoxy-1,4-benzoquinol methylase